MVLTAKGHKRTAEGRERWEQAQSAIAEQIGPERFERLLADLQAVIGAVGV